MFRRRPTLRLLVLEISDRCDQRCAHCQIWSVRSAAAAPLALVDRLQIVDDALRAGAREALLTGGEPLLSEDLWPVAERLSEGGARLMLATTGMQLERHATSVARLFSEVYVSLDGGRASTHDGLRGVASFARLGKGIAALRAASPRPTIVARSTLHRSNVGELLDIVAAARRLGVDHVSFLPIDARSAAFGGRPDDRAALVPTETQIRALEEATSTLQKDAQLRDGFILETPTKLRRLARHLAASGGRGRHERPRCDAPRWSSVVTVDGALKPCFFHPSVGDVGQGLVAVRASRAYADALARIEAPNDICESCVCPKWRGASWREALR
jgi:MoaA/NifB/PqqE/SkfB family radical SAM enzyme